MYLMYVDESGDNGPFDESSPGAAQNGSPLFVLSGLIISIDHWNEFLDELKRFRDSLRRKHGFLAKYELHARELIVGSGFFQRKGVNQTTRTAVYRATLEFLSKQKKYLNLMSVCVDKSRKWNYDAGYVETAWRLLIQRFDNFVYKKNSHGLILSDVGYHIFARRVYRRMRVHNPIPSKKMPGVYYEKPLRLIIEDPNWRSSRHSYFLQLVDIACDAVKVKKRPSGKAKKRGICDLWKLLDPIMVVEISPSGDGIVECP